MPAGICTVATRLQIITTHVIFGLGLYLAASLPGFLHAI
jgi:hypothetical protein